MKALKGIMINGEWLGSKVVINGLFRTICAISPSIMQEFIKLINSIEKLDNTVSIENFSFYDRNSINIGFKNQHFKGLVKLSFCAGNGEFSLEDKSIELIDLNENNRQVADEVETQDSYTEQKEISDSLTVENSSRDITPKTFDAECLSKDVAAENSILESTSIERNCNENLIEFADIEKPHKEDDENATELNKNSYSELISDFANQTTNVVPQTIELIITNNANNQDCCKKQKDSYEEINDEPELISLETTETTEMLEMTEESQDTIDFKTKDDKIAEELDCSKTVDNANQNDIQDLVKEESIILEENKNQDKFVSNQDEQQCSETAEIDSEEIENCLSDFYNISSVIEKTGVKETVNDDIVMPAILNEMLNLREELNKIKEESHKYSPVDLSNKNNVDDEDADFKIMSNGERLNASFIEEDLFIAGDKLYRWGDTLYLEK